MFEKDNDSSVSDSDTKGMDIFSEAGLMHTGTKGNSLYKLLDSQNFEETDPDESENVSESDTYNFEECTNNECSKNTEEENKTEPEILGFIIKVNYTNGAVYDSKYSAENWKKAIEDMYNESGRKEISVKYGYKNSTGEVEKEYITEIMHMKDDTDFQMIDFDISIPPSLKIKILEFSVKASQEIMRLTAKDYNRSLSNESKQKILDIKKNRINIKKLINKKKTRIDNVFIDESFAGHDFSGIDFSGYVFIRCELKNTNFTCCNLIDTMFIGCSLDDAITENAVFENTLSYSIEHREGGQL